MIPTPILFLIVLKSKKKGKSNMKEYLVKMEAKEAIYLYVKANSEEEAKEKVNTAMYRGDGILCFDLDDESVITDGGYNTEWDYVFVIEKK